MNTARSIAKPDSNDSFEQLRLQVMDEAHKRPPFTINPPCRMTHLLYLNQKGDDGGANHLQTLWQQATNTSNTTFEADDSCRFAHFPKFTLRWERHTEFSTYSFIVSGTKDHNFSDNIALADVPQEWLDNIPGQRLAAFQLLICTRLADLPDSPTIDSLFSNQTVYGGDIMSGKARVWTSFRTHQPDDFNRIIIETKGLKPTPSGRLLQNILELESYRLLALLTFPLARSLTPKVRQFDEQMMKLVEDLAATKQEAAKPLLVELLTLATAIENKRARSNYRFNATRAYASLVRKRLQMLREARPESQTSLSEFLELRFSPAIETCEAVEGQLKGLSRRIARAGDLLRTRIDLDIQNQNQALLASMDRRASLQLRLQQTVEGLSIFAISYYVMGLVSYALKPWAPGKWLTAALVPVVVASVWLMVRGIRKRIRNSDDI